MFRIVIAEHDDLVRRRAALALSSINGLEVVAKAPNGWVALELLRVMEANVAIVGMDLPPMGGLTLIRAIREVAPATLVVGMSSTLRPATARQAFAYGACGFLVLSEPVGGGSVSLRLVAPDDEEVLSF
jgi:DNA-binding NarL/FixJ family response regulator